MKDVDASLVVALGLIGVVLYGLGSSRSRSDDRLAQELDRLFKKQDMRLTRDLQRLRVETQRHDSELRGIIEELDQRTASRIWELEKLAGLAPGDDNDAD